MIELESGYTLINTGWRLDHGREENLRLYFSKDENGKGCVFLDTLIEEVLMARGQSPMPFPLRVWFVCVYWNETEKILTIHPAESAKEGAREIDPEEAFGSDDIRRWRDDDIEALLQLKAPIEDGIGYYVDGEWDSDRQCLIYDLNKRKPIKEGVTA